MEGDAYTKSAGATKLDPTRKEQGDSNWSDNQSLVDRTREDVYIGSDGKDSKTEDKELPERRRRRAVWTWCKIGTKGINITKCCNYV